MAQISFYNDFVYISDDMVDDMLNSDYKDFIQTLTSSKYHVDLKLKPKTDEPASSFRKLNLD